jgi:hypothetical protein
VKAIVKNPPPKEEEGDYAFALTLFAVHGTLEINFPLRSYRSNTILFFSRMYFDEVLEISRLSSEPERSAGMLEVGVKLLGLGVTPVWFIR